MISPTILGRYFVLAVLLWIVAPRTTAQTPVDFSPSRTVAAPTIIGSIVAAQILGTPHEEFLTFAGPILNITNADPAGATITTTIAVGGNITSVAAGDLNLDGDADIVCKLGGGAVKVLSNQGAGVFTIATLSTSSTQPIHLADFTGDGYLDILCGGHRFTNNGAGSFPTSIVFSPGTTAPPIDVIPGDFDGDGDQDIMSIYVGTIPAGSGVIACIFQNSAGTMTQLPATLLDSGAFDAFPTVADINGDGRDDLILSTPLASDYFGYFGRRFRAFLGQVGTTIVPQAAELVQSAQSVPFKLADWNDDGFPDLAILVTAARGTLNLVNETRIGVLLNDGNGGFSPAIGPGVDQQSGLLPTFPILSLGATDDDSDGDVDLVVVQNTQLRIFRNDSATALPSATQITDPAAGTIVARSLLSRIYCDVTLSDLAAGPLPLPGHFVMIDFVSPTGVPYRLTHLTSTTGQVAFSLPSGYAGTTIPITISTPEGLLGNFTIVTSATLSLTGGAGQSAITGTPFAPLTGQLLDATAAPIAGVRVYGFQNSGPTVFATFQSSVTDAGGNFAVQAVAGAPGTTSCYCIVPESTFSPIFSLTSLALVPAVNITQGAGQVVCGGAPIVPIVGTVLTQFGSPVSGLSVSIAPNGPPGPTPVTFNATTTSTNAQGVFTFTGVGNSIATTRSYSVTVGGSSASASFNLSCQLAPVISVTSGQGQTVDLDDVLSTPIVVSVTDCFGAPLPGQTVNLVPQTVGVAVPFTTMITDALGQVSFLPTFTYIGHQRVRASVGSAFVDATTLVRGLTTVNAGFLFAVSFQHDHANVPLLLAVDNAPPSPFLSTPYGDIWTSVLAPQPTLAYLDGFGLFGSIDPGMTTNAQGTWLRTYAVPPQILNLNFVAQMYGYDALKVFPQDYVVSNPAFFSL